MKFLIALVLTLTFGVFFQNAYCQTTVTVGSGTSTQSPPFDQYYYTRSAGLYSTSQIGNNGLITHLGWYVGTTHSTARAIKIYLKTTTSSSLTADTWANMISGATLVYDASRAFSSAGWNTIDISDYTYTSNNLLVLCEYNGGSWYVSEPTFRYTTTTNQHMYYQGGSPPSGSGTVNNQLPNLQITFATAMRYSSSTTETASSASLYAGSANKEIIRLNVVTTGTQNPVNATSITFNTNGSTSASDISYAKVYYTTSTSFSTGTQFGSATANPNGSFTVTGSQALATGNNYFWLAYDIPITATGSNVVDGECTSVTVDGTARTPTATAPSGTRTINFAPVTINASAGTASAIYNYLYDAVAKINDGTHQGVINVFIGNNITESSDISINASGSGSASYSSINIRPCGGATRTITRATSSSNGMLRINGGDNITIDGLNANGNALVFINTYNYNSPVISLVGASSGNYCSNNTITNCTVKGNNEGTNYGVLCINNYVNNLTISNNNLTAATPASYHPSHLIWSYGASASYPNSSITITANNLYDYGSASGMAAVYLYNYNTNCIVSNNKIYQTSSRSFSCNYNYWGIYTGDGSGYTITGNTIGYASSSGTGSTSLNFSGYATSFIGIHLLTDNTSSSTINNNVIAGINTTYSVNRNFYAIYVDGCNSTSSLLTVEVSGNTIGSSTSDNSLVFNESSDCRLDLKLIHIGNFSSSAQYKYNATISNNVIGGINTGTTYVPWQVYMSVIVGSGNGAADFAITGNTIGYAACPIKIGTSSTSALWKFEGIYLTDYSGSGADYTITDNTINYIFNYSTYSSAEMCGIYNGQSSTSTTKVITGNTISDFTSGYQVIGIYYPNGYPRNSTISNNTIKNLNAGDDCYGMYLDCGYSTVINSNFITRLSTSNTAKTIYGIYLALKSTTGNSVCNNIVSLGKNSSGTDIGNILMYGIHDNGYSNYYFNSLVLTGTVSSSSVNSYCFYRSSSNNSTSLKNNIFANLRANSSGSGKHYAIQLNSASSLTINYNDYYTPNTGGYIGYLSSDRQLIANWRTATGQDVNSVNTDPSFTNSTGTSPSDYLKGTTLNGTPVSGIDNDYFGSDRDNSNPQMGAFEGGSVSWTGTTNTSWNTGTNWSGGVVPNSGADINIPGSLSNYPQLDMNVTTNNLTISSGASLIIPYGKALTVNGTLTNNAGNSGLIVQSNSNGSGSLITSSSVSGTVQRYINGGSPGYIHFISPPISNATGANLSGGSYGNFKPFSYNEASSSWVFVSSSTSLSSGVGYYAAYDANKTLSFEGTINTGNVTVAVTTSGSTYTGYNLLGNPYPCRLSANSFVGDGDNSEINGSLYFWVDDHSGSTGYSTADYATWNVTGGTGASSSGGGNTTVPNNYIESGQGFFVLAGSAGNVIFKNSHKTHSSSSTFFVPPVNDKQRVWLKLTNNEFKFSNSILIGFLENATTGVDRLYDAIKNQGNENISFYSLIENNQSNYVIQGLPSLSDSTTIKLGFYANVAGEYSISIDSIDNMNNTEVFLYDALKNSRINLTKCLKYQFTTDKGRFDSRFTLYFYPQISSNEEIKSQDISVYSVGKIIIVNQMKNQNKCGLTIINSMGQTIKYFEINGNDSFEANLSDLPKGCYMYYLKGNELDMVGKIILN